MKLKTRLMLLSAIFAFGFLVSGLFSFTTLSQVKVNGPIYAGIVQQKDLLADILPPPEYLVESYLLTLMMREADKAALPALVEKSRTLQKDFEDRRAFWAKELPEGEAKTLLVEKAYQPGREFLELQQKKFIPALQAGDAAAVEALRGPLAQAYGRHRSAVDELVQVATANAARQEQDAAAAIQSKTVLSVVLVALLLAAGLFFAWRTIRTVVGQLGGEPAYAAEIASRMAAGELTEIDLEPGDKGSLLAAMRNMVETFKAFAVAQAEMARQHEAGMIDAVIPAAGFPGIYGRMAESINLLVASHVAVTLRVVEVVKGYAVGDLSADMEPLPGRKAEITAAIAGVKSSLQAVNRQIRDLVEAAVNGDFKARGNAAAFQNEFHAMVEGLNRLMEIS
ncbi:MAG: hypothetical protein JNM82_08450, partial [Rhodocyclaceae bacterium]|nr:hypothetical protein [Rhodocyclaceae bacterium]